MSDLEGFFVGMVMAGGPLSGLLLLFLPLLLIAFGCWIARLALLCWRIWQWQDNKEK